jgi:hypothetical protein
MQTVYQRIYADPMDKRRLLLSDGRPVLAVIGGGHEQPFSFHQLAEVSAFAVEAWNVRQARHEINPPGAPTRDRARPLPEAVEIALADLLAAQFRLGLVTGQRGPGGINSQTPEVLAVAWAVARAVDSVCDALARVSAAEPGVGNG